MYTVLMDDGRCVRKHIDLLRSRASTTRSSEIESNGDDDFMDIDLPNERNVEVEDTSETLIPAEDTRPERESPREAAPEVQVEPRRSTRPRRSPDRYGQ